MRNKRCAEAHNIFCHHCQKKTGHIFICTVRVRREKGKKYWYAEDCYDCIDCGGTIRGAVPGIFIHEDSVPT